MVIGGVATVAGGAMEAEAAKAEAQATYTAEMENADISEQNKIIANQKRIVDVQTAEADARDSEREKRRTLASIRTAFGGSGSTMDGSPLDVLSDVAVTMTRDTERIRDEGLRRNREGALRYLGFEKEASSARRRAKYALEAGERGVAAAGINTVTRLSRIIS